jgi:hypothetical protein
MARAAIILGVLLHIPLWLEAPIFALALGFALWQERGELKRLWCELRTGERIESKEDR